MQRRAAFRTQTTALAAKRQIKALISTEALGRDDLIVVTAGVDLTHFRTNPVVLWQHSADAPCARALTIEAIGDRLESLIQFPEAGKIARSDEVWEYLQAKIISACSIGFEVIEGEPVDPKEPFGAYRVLRSELAEFSFVSIGAERNSLVSERSGRGRFDPGREERRRTAARFQAEIDRERAEHRRHVEQLQREISDERLLQSMKPATRSERHRLAELLQRAMAAGR